MALSGLRDQRRDAPAIPDPLPIDDAAALTLDERGNIQGWDGAAERLFGYRREELPGLHISTLFPQLAGIELFENGVLNRRLRYLCRIGVQFQGVRCSGERFASDLFLSDLCNPRMPRLRMVVLCRPCSSDSELA